MQRTDNISSESGSNTGYQDGLNAASSASTSSNLGPTNGPHNYPGYTSYPNSTDPYGYGNTSYPGYYYGYQQPANPSYSQQGVAYQNSGAPYHNTGSYASSTTSNHSSTYYNPGDYQRTGVYQSSGCSNQNSVYSNQSSTWNDGNYLHHNQYSNYTSTDSNVAQSSSTASANLLHHQQQYKQWADYYNQTASDVSCAPGTENTSVSTMSSLPCPILGVTGVSAKSNSQPPPPSTSSSSWRPDSSSSEVPSFQASTTITDAGWKIGTPGFPSHQKNQIPANFQKPSDTFRLHYDNTEDQQNSVCPQGTNLQFPAARQVSTEDQQKSVRSQGTNLQFPAAHQVFQSFHSPLQTVSALDSSHGVSKLQIPTNPRITSTLTLGMPKTGKNGSTADAASKPAYISVSMPKSSNKVASHDAADAMLKVRPEEVLEKALSIVQSSEKNYLYKCDQLKSIRQDLTVQRIHNELTVKVYETHARLALEAGDLPEYNQCESQLKGLYAEGIKGCHTEFSAYNLLCVIMHSDNNRDLLSSMARLSVEAKKDESIKHALAVRAAVTSGNYISFFRLYRIAPNLNSCLMELYAEKMRFEAVRCISRAYRPTVPMGFIAQVLGFSAEGNDERDSDGLEDCEEWLKAHGASLTLDNNGELQLDTKVTTSSLYMPDPEDAVAHGDSTLAVNDFLTRT